MARRKFGWHSGKLNCNELIVENTVSLGSLDFGAAELDSLLIKGRVATSSVAGAALSLPADYTYGEGMELRYSVASWTGVGSSFRGMYVRSEAGIVGATHTLMGMELYGVANNVGVQNLKGLLSYAYIKGATAKTVGTAYGIHAELSWDAGASTTTITTEMSMGLFRLTGGVADDYTKIHGAIFRFGDMDGASRVYGNGILIEDDSATSGTASLTTGLNITMAVTTGISLSGTKTTGLSITGTTPTGIAIGTSGTNIAHTAVTDKLQALYVTCNTTNGSTSYEPFLLSTTLTGAGQVGGRARFYMTTNVALGGWSNALKAEVTYGASGSTSGLGSALLAEMTMAAGTTSGTYAPLEIELNMGSNAPIGTNTSLAYLSVNGTATNFINSGYVLNLQGLGAATSGKIFQANTATAASHALRIIIGATPYYLMLTETGA